MNKKQVARTLLELIAEIDNVPTKGNSIDMDKFYELEEIKAIITLLKFMKIDGEWLLDKGFMPAHMVLGPKLTKKN